MPQGNGRWPRADRDDAGEGSEPTRTSTQLIRSSKGLVASSARMIRATMSRLGEATGGEPEPQPPPASEPLTGHVLLVGMSAAVRRARPLLGRFPLFVSAQGPKALEHLQEGHRPHLILVDLTLASTGGWALLRELSAHEDWSHIPDAALLPSDQLWTAAHLPVIKALPPDVQAGELQALVGFFVTPLFP